MPCMPLLYSLGPPSVPQCTPGVSPSADGGGLFGTDGLMGCGRVLRDDFINADERLAFVALFERSMTGLFHQGAQTSFAPESKSSAKHMGAAGRDVFFQVQERVRSAIKADFGVAELYSAGSLLMRIWAPDMIPADGMDIDPAHKTDNVHVDKANRASYDYSALLYINGHCHAPREWRASHDVEL